MHYGVRVYLDISHRSKEFIIEKLPRMYRQYLDTLMIDISEQAMEVSPTAHYSMGGILVDPESHQTEVEGLFAAGEVTGGLHGANRLGGNSLAEILIFGKRAGKYASERSISMDTQKRSKEKISVAHERIDNYIKPGSFMARPLQRKLRNIMWENCGVVRDNERLELGLKEIDKLSECLSDLDVRPDSEGFEDLVLAFDLEGSIVSAKATMLSAHSRKESRGAHQRSDYERLDCDYDLNFITKLNEKNKIEIFERPLSQMSAELDKLISETKIDDNIEGKLLE